MEGGGRVFNLAFAVLGARWLGPGAWGAYWSLWGNAQLLGTATDLGGHLTMSRDISRAPKSASVTMGASATTKLVLCAATGAIAVIFQPEFGRSGWPFLVVAALALSWSEWIGYAMRGFGRIREESLLLACGAALSLTGLLIGWTFGWVTAGPRLDSGLPGMQCASMLLLGAGSLWWATRLIPVRWSPAPARTASGFLTAALPTGIAILVSMTSWRFAYVATALTVWRWNGHLTLDGDWLVQLGYYSAAHRLLEVGRFLPAAVSAALLPNLSTRSRPIAPGAILRVLFPVTMAVAILAQVPSVTPFVSRLFGSQFTETAPVLRVILLALPLLTINSVLTTWLVARGWVKTNMALSAVHLTTHSVLVFISLQPGIENRATWLAWSLVVAEFMLMAGTLIAWRRLK